MLSNSLPDGDLNRQEMKTKSPTCPSGGYHMYEDVLQGRIQPGCTGCTCTPPCVRVYIHSAQCSKHTECLGNRIKGAP